MVNPKALQLSVHIETWPIAGHFTISRGAKTEAKVVVAELTDGKFRGRGECVPYARYGESVDAVAATLENLAQKVAAGLSHKDVQSALPAGAARNALDCAFWDLEAKRTGTPCLQACRARGARPVDHGLYDLAGFPRGDGECSQRGERAALAQNQVGR